MPSNRVRDLARRDGGAAPFPVAGVVREGDGVERPGLAAEALQREQRRRIADIAAGDPGLDREHGRHVSAAAESMRSNTCLMSRKMIAPLTTNRRDPRRMHRAALPGMGDEQAGEPDHREERDHERQVPHVVDEQRIAPAGSVAVEPVLQPQKGERDRPEAQHHAAGVVARAGGGAGEKRADDREHAQDEQLQPEAEPRPEGAFRSIGQSAVPSSIPLSSGTSNPFPPETCSEAGLVPVTLAVPF